MNVYPLVNVQFLKTKQCYDLHHHPTIIPLLKDGPKQVPILQALWLGMLICHQLPPSYSVNVSLSSLARQ